MGSRKIKVTDERRENAAVAADSQRDDVLQVKKLRLEGRSYEEIASIMNKKESSVRLLLKAAKLT